jgi:hypothetical protein
MHLVEKIILSTLQRPVPNSDVSTHWGLSFTRICLHYRVLCFTWSFFLYRSLNCTWTLLISTRRDPLSTQMASRSILTASMSTITDMSRGSTDVVDQTSPTTAEAAVGKTHPGNIVCCTDMYILPRAMLRAVCACAFEIHVCWIGNLAGREG